MLDFANKTQKSDENAIALFQVPVFAAGSRIKDSTTVKVAGEVKVVSGSVFSLDTQSATIGCGATLRSLASRLCRRHVLRPRAYTLGL